MIISKDFYDQCDLSYQRVIDELEEKLSIVYQRYDECSDEAARKFNSIVLGFSYKYLTPKDYWEHCFDALESYENTHSFDKLEIDEKSHFHLYVVEQDFGYLRQTKDKYSKLIEYQRKPDLYADDEHKLYHINESELSFPHSDLEKCFHAFESLSQHAVTCHIVKRCENMKAMYLKIKAAEIKQDLNEWFKLLTQVDDTKFVSDNVEYCLGHNLLDKNLWKLYITYLKKIGEYDRLLKTCSKYCRFFLDDIEAFEQYKTDTAKYGPVKLYWKNLYDFEMIDKSSISDEPDSESENEEDEKNDSYEKFKSNVIKKPVENAPFDFSICSTFYENYHFQEFSLPAPYIAYILKNANHRQLRKLYASCKYFFRNHPAPLCHLLQLNNTETIYDNENISLQLGAEMSTIANGLYVFGNIHICMDDVKITQNNVLSTIIPHFSKCDAKYIHIDGQDLKFNELKFLVEHGGVIHLEFHGKLMDNQNVNILQLENLVPLLPKIEKLILSCIGITENTAHVLVNQNFGTKIHQFHIRHIIGSPFNTNEFLNYYNANTDEYFSMSLGFNADQFDNGFVKVLIEVFTTFFGDRAKIEMFRN